MCHQRACSRGDNILSFRTVFIENRCRCSYQGGYLVVRKELETAKVHLSEISSIVLQTTQVYISAYLLMELAKAKIPLIVSDEKANPIGEFLPIYGAHNPTKHVQEQLAWGLPIKKRVWQKIVKDKIEQQMKVLLQEGFETEARLLKNDLIEVKSGDITNREAHAAKVYFATLFGKDFTRSSDCAINAALNYGYAILLSMVNREIVARGFLTQCGINHRNEYNQYNLACDFMEPFRPVVDCIVLENVGVEFERSHKLLLGDLANKKLKYSDGIYRLASVLSYYVQACINALNKAGSVEDIEGFEIP